MFTERAGYAHPPLPSADSTWQPNYWRPDRAADWRPAPGGPLFQTTSNYGGMDQPPVPRIIPPRPPRDITTPMKEMMVASIDRQMLALQHLRASGGSISMPLLRKLTEWDRHQAGQVGKALVKRGLIIRKHGHWIQCQTDRTGRRQPVIILSAAPPTKWRRDAILSHLRANYPAALNARALVDLTGLTMQEVRNAGRILANEGLIARNNGNWRAVPLTQGA